MKQVEFKIEGIKCEGCVNRIKKVLAKCSGIEAFDLSLETKILKVSAQDDQSIEVMKEKIEALDFTVLPL